MVLLDLCRYRRRVTRNVTGALIVLSLALPAAAAEPLQPMDVFQLEWASDPQISPDGQRVAYVRNSMDVMKDQRRSAIWIVETDGSRHRPVTSGKSNESLPRWSPDGSRLIWIASEPGEGGSSQIFVQWMDTGQTGQLTRLTEGPGNLSWSPDGRWVAFSMRVPDPPEPMVKAPQKPEGAEWAPPPKVIERMIYRVDGAGYWPDGNWQLFVLPAEGGTPRQLTEGPYDHDSAPAWTADSGALIVSANRHEDADYRPVDTELYRVSVETGELTQLTDRRGPDGDPAVSPDGRTLAYLGFDDQKLAYQVSRLYLMDLDDGSSRLVTRDYDRDVTNPRWSADGQSLVFGTVDRGNGKIGRVDRQGKVEILADNVGGVSLGRPYSSGGFSVAKNGRVAFTLTRPEHPAEVAVTDVAGIRRLTHLNEDLLAHRALGAVEEIVYPSSHDGREIQAWIVKPPDFDPEQGYPMLLEIHGGPFANYGDRFSAELQLYASAGYVVLYINPRGSTSYGAEFANLIHHAYPGHDYDDLMSGVDAVLERGYVDPKRLYVTGGSGGGVLTAWVVGKTDRFRAAVSAKPVINWTSFALTADFYNFFSDYWFPGYPWEFPEEYFRRSPLSLVGNVTTPTMLLTGEVDYRTPISESEQYYQALKLRKIPTALVRIPGASHGIARRPSQLLAKVAHVLAWFDRHALAVTSKEE